MICWPPRTGSLTTVAGRPRPRAPPARRSPACGGARSTGRARAARRRRRARPAALAASFHAAVAVLDARPASAAAGAAARPRSREVERRPRHQRARHRAPAARCGRSPGECAILSSSSGKKFGIVRGEQPQGQDGLQRAAHLERRLTRLDRRLFRGAMSPPDHLARRTASVSWMRVFAELGTTTTSCGSGQADPVYTVVAALLAIFARKGKRWHGAKAIIPAPRRQRAQAPGAPSPPCARSWACRPAAAGTGRN